MPARRQPERRLGAAPGSWTKYAAQRVGPAGRVVVIDLRGIELPPLPNVLALRGDAFVTQASVVERGPYDDVLSDMAPNTSGDRFSDAADSFRLFARAVAVALELGKLGSHFVGKLFMSNDFTEARALVQRHYETCTVIRPKSTRSNSAELFLVGMRRRGVSGSG